MEERLVRLEQENAALKRNINAIERKLREMELQIRQLKRIQDARPRRLR